MLKKSHRLNRKLASILLLSFVAVIGVFQTVEAAEITSATANKEVFLAGQTGYISVAIYNEESAKIQVTELSATIDYYYADGTVYVQKFFTSEVLPDEIEAGETTTYQIPISLPTNIAPGYIDLMVEARTDLWVNQTQRWISSDRPYSQVKLYVESPYKQSYADSQQQLQESEQQLQHTQQELQEQKSVSQNLSTTATALGVVTLAFVGVAAFLMFVLLRRPKPIAQPPQ
jgi:hypothetical protein